MEYKGKTLKSLQNVSQDGRTVNLLLYGVIGVDISGHYFAQDIMHISRMPEVDKIVISINSLGGSIVEGFSILTALNVARTAGKKVTTRAVGIADSMAGIVLAFGDRGSREAYSYATGVVHSPQYLTEAGDMIDADDLPEGNLRNEALQMRDGLLEALSAATGKTKNQLLKVMKKAERHPAFGLLELGMIDTVVKTSNSVNIENRSAVQLMAACSDITPELEMKKSESNTVHEMKNIAAFLNLNEAASEAAVLTAIQALANRAETAEKKVKEYQTGDNSVQALQNKIQTLEADLAKTQKTAVESFVDQNIKTGVFQAEKRESLVNMGVADFQGLKDFTSSLGGKFQDVTDRLGKGSGSGSGDDGERLKALAVKFHNADKSGTLEAFKNEVGEKDFDKAEKYLVDNYNAVTAAADKAE